MIRESVFRQKGVYANRVRISSQNGKIYELSSHKNELAGHLTLFRSINK